MASSWARSNERLAHKDRARAAGDEALRGDAAHFARTDDHHLAVLEVAEDFLREIHGDIADRGGAMLDGRLGADFLAHAEGALEEAVKHAGGGSRVERRLIGMLHLAEDLGFPEHHRVQAADHPAQVAGGRGLF